LPADTNAPPAVANRPVAKPGTNATEVAINTNSLTVAGGTNATAPKRVRPAGTNAMAIAAAAASTNSAADTNLVTSAATNAAVSIVADSNAPIAVAKVMPSNEPPVAVITSLQTNTSGSNVANVLPTNAIVSGTNVSMTGISGGTNLAGASARTNLTNSATTRATAARPPNAATAAMLAGAAGRKPATLPPEIQARVDRVYESEIFAPVAHPMPMALLGIAGKAAFLRAPSGQTGLVKEGDSLGDVKLLKIGMNRVLVEQDGNKQELMIFAGLGGESLLTKTNDASNETTKK
jgi:hypothetical protein